MTDYPDHIKDIINAIEDALQETYLEDLEGTKSWWEYAEDIVKTLGIEQVGWHWYEPRPLAGPCLGSEHPSWWPADDPKPVYQLTNVPKGTYS